MRAGFADAGNAADALHVEEQNAKHYRKENLDLRIEGMGQFTQIVVQRICVQLLRREDGR